MPDDVLELAEKYVNSEECTDNVLELAAQDHEGGGGGETALVWHDVEFTPCPNCECEMTVKMPDAMGIMHTACMECGWVEGV